MTAKTERKAIAFNEHQYFTDIEAARVVCNDFNRFLTMAYSAGMKPLNFGEMFVIESIYHRGIDEVVSKIPKSVTSDLLNSMMGAWNTIKRDVNPLDFKFYAIDENGKLQIGKLSEIRELYTLYLETDEQKAFYKHAIDARKSLIAMYKIRQKSVNGNFRYADISEFMWRISYDIFPPVGDDLGFNAEYLRNI